MEPLLAIKNLHAEYRSGSSISYALNGVNIEIMPHEVFGLVGETGAGKTTTALCTLNLLPKDVGRITQGSITFKGRSILDTPERGMIGIRGKEIAMIFQNPLSSLNPVFTVGEQIALVFRAHERISKKQAEARTEELLKMVGILPDRINDYPHQFSGGMRQRVGIAAALALNPDLLIADEPTTALDVTIQAQILELMKELQNKRSSSLLMITHNLGIISEICQRLAVMYAGAILEVGQVRDVFTNPAHPYTVGLLGAIPDLENKKETLSYIPGNVANSQMLPSGCKFHPRCQHCMDICIREAPPLKDLGNGHSVACWKCEG